MDVLQRGIVLDKEYHCEKQQEYQKARSVEEILSTNRRPKTLCTDGSGITRMSERLDANSRLNLVSVPRIRVLAASSPAGPCIANMFMCSTATTSRQTVSVYRSYFPLLQCVLGVARSHLKLVFECFDYCSAVLCQQRIIMHIMIPAGK